MALLNMEIEKRYYSKYDFMSDGEEKKNAWFIKKYGDTFENLEEDMMDEDIIHDYYADQEGEYFVTYLDREDQFLIYN